MTDMYQRVTDEQDIFKKLLSKVPGFKGYVERETRRSSDKLLRDSLANKFETLWQRISSIQKDMVNQGQIEYVDDLESASIKIRQFIDRVRNASYGYAGLFDAIKIDSEELSEIYRYDLAMFNLADEISRAIDNVEASMCSDGLPAAIKNLTNLAQQCIDTFNQRVEVIKSGVSGGEITTTPPVQ
jgi:hypothetical protein